MQSHHPPSPTAGDAGTAVQRAQCGREGHGEAVLGAFFALLVALMQPVNYYLEIMLPGSVVGMIVGWATQRYGGAASPEPVTAARR